LWAPNLEAKDFGGKKAFYDFSTRPIVENFGGQNLTMEEHEATQTKVSYEKPSYL
jgi:hypothetical protein